MRRLLAALLLFLLIAASCARTPGGTETETAPGETGAEETREKETEPMPEQIIFADPSAANAGTGRKDAPFSSLDDAFSACGETGGTVVLLRPFPLAGDYTPPAHAGCVTLTAAYDGTRYEGKLVLSDGCRFTLAGDTVFDLPIELGGKAVFTADFHAVTFADGAEMSGKADEVILIGGSNGGKNRARDVRITLRNGRFTEITGASRYGKDRIYGGTVYLTLAGKAEVKKIFVGPWGDGAYRYARAEVLLDGGRITTFLCGTHGKDDRCTGSFSLYVTDRFDTAGSFQSPQGSSFGISGTCPNPWGPAEDACRGGGEIVFYAETKSYASLISRLLCDTTSFDKTVKVHGSLLGGAEGGAEDAAAILAARGLAPDGRDRNGDGLLTLADAAAAVNEASPLAGGDVYRPVYHYTRRENFLADPNGLVYDAAAGLYHLYYQAHAGILRDKARSSWGHAVSRDLVHWEEQEGLALSFGHTESGSAVVDRDNTSGLFDDLTPPESRLAAIFSRNEAGVEKQMLAYSKDGGATYRLWGIIIGKSAYVTNEKKAFRDPKVFWYEDGSEPAGGLWLMVVGGGRVQLFSSHDLLHWKEESAAEGKNGEAIDSECPDLFPLTVEDSGERKWLLSCAGVSYYIGSLGRDADGTFRFRAEQDKLPCNGTSSVKGVYAAQSFYSDPTGRRIWINWMPDKSAPLLARDKDWDGLMSLPAELSLVRSGDRILLRQEPAAETDALFGDPVFTAADVPLSSLSLPDMPGNAYLLDATLDLSGAESAVLEVRKGEKETTRILYSKRTGRLSLVTTRSGELAGTGYAFTGGTYAAALEPDADGRVRLRVYVDTISVEVFGGRGEAVVSATVFPDAASSSLAASGDARLVSLTLRPAG